MKKYTFSLPNVLTYMRIASVVFVVLCYFLQYLKGLYYIAHTISASLFIFACITDFFDGYLARIWQQTSNIGRMLDPIADKLLVSSCLLLLAADGTIGGANLVAGIIILCREILVSGLREYLAEIKVRVPVSNLAKWKTTTQMISIILLLWGPAGDKIFYNVILLGIALLWVSAILTLFTGWEYFKESLNHLYD